jgi:hypothetical protein
MRRRSETRRSAREHAATPAGVASPEPDLERLEAERRLGALVVALDEPLRQAIFLCYGEGLTSAQAGARLGVPAGTVRWRLKLAVDELRGKLGVAPARRRGLVLLLKGALATSAVKLWGALLLALFIGGVAVGTRGPWKKPEPKPAEPMASVQPVADRRLDPSAPAALPSWFAQEGASPRRIAGRVEDGERPAEGARVRLISALTELHIVPVAERTVGKDGGFDFGMQPPGNYSVVAWAPGRHADGSLVSARGPSKRPLVLRLGPCAATVFGTVLDGDGQPIAGAAVSDTGGAFWTDVATSSASLAMRASPWRRAPKALAARSGGRPSPPARASTSRSARRPLSSPRSRASRTERPSPAHGCSWSPSAPRAFYPPAATRSQTHKAVFA